VDSIYLSPSNQAANTFALGGYNESSYARGLCLSVRRFLTLRGYTSCIVGEESRSPYNRPAKAKAAGCNLYLALHSGFSYDHRAAGTVCFYHPKDNRSIRLSNRCANALTGICPIEPTDDEPVRDGTRIYGKLSLVEISKPQELGMTPVLIEVNFHDNPDTCRWMIDSIEEIAKTIATAISETFAH
jgi:N-acetylmuramoyl-L-alanine amidase